MGKHAPSSSSICVVLLATIFTSVSLTNAKEVVHGRVSSSIFVVPPTSANSSNNNNNNGKNNRDGATDGGGGLASLPSSLEVNVTLDGNDVHLQLEKDAGSSPNDLPVYVLSTDSKGREQTRRAKLPDTEYAVYLDLKNEAAFGVYQEKDSNGTDRIKMEGIVHTAGKIYDLKSIGHTRRTAVRRKREVADQDAADRSHNTNANVDPAANGSSSNDDARDESGGSGRQGENGEAEEEEFEVEVMPELPVDVMDSLPEPLIIQRKKEMKMMPLTLNSSHPPLDGNLSPPRGPLHRRRRSDRRTREATQTNIYVDVVAVADYGVYKTWYGRSTATTATAKQQDTLVKLRRYYAFVFNGVTMIYDKITSSSYKIKVRLSSVVISAAASSSNWTERLRRTAPQWEEVDASSALKAASNWAASTDVLPSYDHLMFFTGYDLSKIVNNRRSDSITGLAYTGTVCSTTGKASSIVEDLGGFQCMRTAAHELGHGLLAEHDGVENTCRSEDRYVMAAGTYDVTSVNKYNPWIFSSCSVSYFNTFISQKLATARGRQCLNNPLTLSSSVTNVTSLMEGQLYNPDEQCRQMYGPNSRLCRGPEFGSPGDMCTDMFCYDPTTTGTCYQLVAARGTTCGNKKWCEGGRCVTNSAAPAAQENCVFGDQPGVAFQNKTCQEFVDEIPGYCYQNVVRVRCCGSCQRHYQLVQNCEYGDKSVDCSSSYCPHASQSYKESCCGTCKYGDPITTSTSSTTTTTTTTTSTTTTTTTPLPTTTINPVTITTSPPGTAKPSTSTAPTTITTTTTPTTTTTTPTTTTTTPTTTTTTTTSPTTTTTPTTTTPTTTTTTPTTTTTTATSPTTTTTTTTSSATSTTTPITSTGKGTSTPTLTPIPTIVIPTTTANTFSNTSTITTSSDDTTEPSKTSPADASCVDNSTITINQKSCSALVASSPESCYHLQVITHCCKSCREASTGTKDCEYGDRRPSLCNAKNLTDVCDRLAQECCNSCFTAGQDPSTAITSSVLTFSVAVALLLTLSI